MPDQLEPWRRKKASVPVQSNLKAAFLMIASAAILTACSSGSGSGDATGKDSPGEGDSSGIMAGDGGASTLTDGSSSGQHNSADAGSRDGRTDAETDSASGHDGLSDGAVDLDGALPEGTCSDLQNTAPAVQYATVQTAPPAPMGGTIAAGTYYLTQTTSYAPCLPSDAGPPALRYLGESTTWLTTPSSATAGIIDEATTVDEAYSPLRISYTTEGTILALDYFCPESLFGIVDGGVLSGPSFSATSAQIDLFYTDTTNGADGGDCGYTFVDTYTNAVDYVPPEAAAPAYLDASDVIDGGACVSLEDTALEFEIEGFTTPPPTAIGGTIAAGTYSLSALQYYGPCAGFASYTANDSATLLVTPSSGTAGVIEFSSLNSEANGIVADSSVGPYEISGSTLTILPATCPAVDGGVADPLSFTATSSELDLIAPNQMIYGVGNQLCTVTGVEVYTKQ
jgi:hypothetical protein